MKNVYICSVHDGSGFGYTWTKRNKRKAMTEVRKAVADRYRNQTTGKVCIAGEPPMAKWQNHNGRAVRVTV